VAGAAAYQHQEVVFPVLVGDGQQQRFHHGLEPFGILSRQLQADIHAGALNGDGLRELADDVQGLGLGAGRGLDGVVQIPHRTLNLR
jgi:hypothetical protein